jgi:hypothetical protein
MDDFFKTKVGFTIGLLAAVFAFKPLVDANPDLGFSIFSVKLTVKYAYIFLTAFLGLAVYFISIQFASVKHVALLDKVSNACYSIALSTPPVFIVFWLLTETFSFVGNYLSLIPESVINILVGMLTGLFANFAFSGLMKSIKSKFIAAEKQQERKEDIELLARSQELFKSGMYDMSVLESSKVVESAIKRLLEAKGVSTDKVAMYELVELSAKNRILGNQDIEFLHEIRVKRNESVHLVDAVDKVTAERILYLSRDLISKLDATSSSSGYEWLEKNRAKVLEQFREGNVNKCRKALEMLKIAWKNRDGAVWLELSEFFEVALINNPQLIVAIFRDDRELLESWLKSAEVQLFTDFLGGDIERLQKVHTDIMDSLINYVNSDNNSSDIELGNLILDVIENSEVREID